MALCFLNFYNIFFGYPLKLRKIGYFLDMDIKWQCYIETEMGYQLVSESFPSRFNRNDVTRAFEGRYNTKVLQVNPISC